MSKLFPLLGRFVGSMIGLSIICEHFVSQEQERGYFVNPVRTLGKLALGVTTDGQGKLLSLKVIMFHAQNPGWGIP